MAVETVGNWYWVVDEIEAGGGKPQLVNARLAKLMMGSVNKSDKLDAKGINRLQRTGTLPTVWIPSSSVRDARELPRTRMVLSAQRTQLKNRVHATLGKYGYTVEGASDAFGKRGRKIMTELFEKASASYPTGPSTRTGPTRSRGGESQSYRSRKDQGFCSLSGDDLA